MADGERYDEPKSFKYRFPKGQSGNPKGRPQAFREISRLAKSYAPEAIDKLVSLMRGRHSNLSLKAAEVLLDRAYGKPPVAITGPGGDGPVAIKYEVSWKASEDGGVTIDLEPKKEPILLEGTKVPDDE